MNFIPTLLILIVYWLAPYNALDVDEPSKSYKVSFYILVISYE